jgi:integrase
VQAIDLGFVMKVLGPLWRTKPETGSRCRGRIEAILNWASVNGYRQGENPARWRGHLEQVLGNVEKARKAKRELTGRGEHHAAMPYADVAAFMIELHKRPGVSARALEFAIATAARTGEVIGARWREIDFAKRVWTVPADRMKGGKEHRVPLSDVAMAVLNTMRGQVMNEFVFPGDRRDHLSDMALEMVLRRMKVDPAVATVHGFRSSFRDWGGEETKFQWDILEVSIAHTVGGKTQQAYQRGDLFERRRQVMTAWGRYISSPQRVAKVVNFPGSAR